jgi:hypothetical protein
MADASKIYVRLLDEGVDVWRPVAAENLRGSVYRIVSQPYDAEVETWQFVPGDEVVCEPTLSDGRRLLVATRRAAELTD